MKLVYVIVAIILAVALIALVGERVWTLLLSMRFEGFEKLAAGSIYLFILINAAGLCIVLYSNSLGS